MSVRLDNYELSSLKVLQSLIVSEYALRHVKKAWEGRSVLHLTIALIELLPIVGIIVSLFERFVVYLVDRKRDETLKIELDNPAILPEESKNNENKSDVSIQHVDTKQSQHIVIKNLSINIRKSATDSVKEHGKPGQEADPPNTSPLQINAEELKKKAEELGKWQIRLWQEQQSAQEVKKKMLAELEKSVIQSV